MRKGSTEEGRGTSTIEVKRGNRLKIRGKFGKEKNLRRGTLLQQEKKDV